MKGRKLYATGRFLVSLIVVFVLVFGDFLSFEPPYIGAPHTDKAEAAQSTIDATASATTTSAIHGPPQTVFVSDTVGYRFLRDQGGTCGYSKTSDSGNTWGAVVTVFSQISCSNIAVWYDQWTPGLTGSKIHIVMMNVSPIKLFYNVLDTSNDTLGDGSTGTTTDPSNVQTGSFTEGANYPAITEGTNGNLYVSIVDNTDSYVLRCTTTCTTASNWTEPAANPFTNADGDFVLLEPLAGGNIMAINRRQTGQIIQYKTWNGTTWSGSWTAIDGSSLLNTTYDIGMSAVVSSSTGKIYLAWTADNVTLGTDDDVRAGTWNGATWATSTVILNSVRGLTGVSLGLNKGNDDLYLVYTGATTPASVNTQNVYWRLAQNGSTTQFAAENGTTVNTAASNLFGIDVNGVSDQRIFASWYSTSTSFIAGDTIADIAPGITVAASTTMIGNVSASTSGQYLGGKFVFRETQDLRNITAVTVTASGTASATTAFKNVKLVYDQDVTYPYNCDSESYVGTEAQYGSTGSFNASGTITFSGSLAVSTTSTMCAYIVTDIASGTRDGSTVDWTIASPPTNVTITGGGTILPTTSVAMASSTAIHNGDRTLAHFHWRLDDGGQATSSSATNAQEDTLYTNLSKYINSRLRIEVSNRGSTTTFPSQYRLEYAQKQSTCSAITSWTQVGSTADIMMYDTYQIADASNTTNIATSTGGTTDDKTTFLTPNGGFKDTGSQTAAITLTQTQFTELEYSVIASTSASDNASYCFRVTDAGTPLEIYAKYPEAKIKLSTDFFVQRGITLIPAAVAGATITAGVDYKAPAASTSAYIRITNTQNTGAGSTAGTASQNANSVTAYISNASNLQTSVTFSHTAAAAGITRVEWEIVEYKGPVGGANEIKVRQQEIVTFGVASTTATSSVAAGVINGSSTAVFITGEFTPSAALTLYHTGLATSDWSSSTKQAVFTRAATGTLAAIVSYAAVEFTGANWNVQRIEHTYSAVNATETVAIAPVNSLSQTFIHVQKRSTQNNHANYGHEVWLSSVGQVSFVLDAAATIPAGQTTVAWIIENTQTSGNTMVVTRSNGTQTGGTAPLTLYVNIGKSITDVSNASIFANNRDSAALATWPEPIIGVRLTSTSTTQYEFWFSNTGDSRSYRAEVVEWPTAQRQLTQNYYRIYTNVNALKPTDPWPTGAVDLGENTAMTGFDQPMNTGDVARIRMSLNVSGLSSMPAGIDAFKLQFANRASSTCSAATAWSDVGDAASTTALWRGFINSGVVDETPLSTNPPTPGDLILSVANRAGTYESNGGTSTATPYAAVSGDDIEYDWVVQDSLAASRASYCFRMVQSDGTALTAYNFYPTLKTIGYGVESKKWRWYDDAQNATPTTTFAAETVTPINISYNNAIALRLTLRESQGAAGSNIKFKLQYSESPTFGVVNDVVATTTCTDGVSLWCYAELGGTDNTTIASSTLSDADSCIAGVGRGCGMYNTSPLSSSTLSQQATSSAEFSFTIRNAGARVNRTYYFRAWDMQNNEAVVTASGESYPSLTTEGSSLNFAVSGIATSTVVAGVTTDVATTPTSIPFGSFTGSSTKNAAYQLSVDTDATQGYQVFVYQSQNLSSSNGGTILPVTGTNASPGGWATVCPTSQASCFGYHTIDATLAGGSARFAPNDTYAGLTTSPAEVAQYSAPITGDAVTVVYRVTTRSGQSSGAFDTTLSYLVVPVF